MESRGVGWTALVALLVPLLLGVASAEAKKKHKKPKSPPVTVVSVSRPTSTDNQQLTVTATCPAGLIAVGGGFLSPLILDSSGSPTDLNIVYESRRSADNAWQVSAVREDNSSPGPDLPVTSSVDCRSTKLAKTPGGKKAAVAKRKRRLRVTEVSASASSLPTPAAQANATATCPPDTQAVGGGFSSSPTPVTAGSAAYPFFWANYRNSPTSWLAAYTNNGTVARTVTSHAYCAAGLRITETGAAATLSAAGPAPGSATATAPRCPRGRGLLGGGFNGTPVTTTSALYLLTGSNAVNRAWQAGAINFNAFPGTLRSSAYCA